jgi:tetratricopeptide (TPR) repeat protein
MKTSSLLETGFRLLASGFWLLASSCWLLAAGLDAAEPQPVPAEVATTLGAEQKAATPEAQLAILNAYHGKAHALIELALGHVHASMGHEKDAGEAYRAALALDPTLHEAAFALARLAAAREDWAEAERLLADHCDPAIAPAPALVLYQQSALARGDLRLALLLDERSLARFPEDQGVRRSDLALLVRAQRPAEAATAARALLELAPNDTEAWRALAWAEQELGDHEGALAALEAAFIAAPEVAARRHLAEAQLGAGQPQAALANLKVLIGAAADPRQLDPPLLALGARAAADSGETALALAWLDAIPDQSRGRELRLFAARLALKAGDPKAAGNALEPLLAAGELDPTVLMWAAAIAERGGDPTRGEALLRQAVAAAGDKAGLARLRLADLLARRGRLEEARMVLREQLSADAGDTQARAMLDALATH